MTYGVFLTLCTITCMILYVCVGQLVVRKLRKIDHTGNFQGLELVSGWGILKVSEAIALPDPIYTRLKNSRYGYFYADKKVIAAHTSSLEYS